MQKLPALDELRRELAERSLAEFIRLGWRYIDPAKYISNWHIDAIAEHLEAVSRGYIRRLIINIPPRHMKSLSVSVAWPAWTWAQATDPDLPLMGPGVQWLSLAYAQSLSVRDNVKCRRLIESPWYREYWGERFALTGDQNTKVKFENDQQGYRIASSVDGTATGEGGSIVTIDDPISAKDIISEKKRGEVITWWDETMSTRLNDPKTGAYVITMQRLHERDLTGHILGRSDDYTVLCLPARYEPDHPHVYDMDPRTTPGELLWPERMGETEIAKLEIALGSYASAGQLQQRPAPRDGGMFKRRWFEIVAAAPAGGRKVRKWDLAGTVEEAGKDPDWTVGTLMSRDAAGFFWIENIIRFRGSPHEVEQAIINTAKADGTSVTVGLSQDPGQAGKFQVRHLISKLAGFNVKSEPETGSKEVRATPFAAQCEAGNVKVVKGDWNDAFFDEAEAFPNAAHDDQVDAGAGAFALLCDGSNAQDWINYYAAAAAAANAQAADSK